jgi:hypothetical protein
MLKSKIFFYGKTHHFFSMKPNDLEDRNQWFFIPKTQRIDGKTQRIVDIFLVEVIMIDND